MLVTSSVTLGKLLNLSPRLIFLNSKIITAHASLGCESIKPAKLLGQCLLLLCNMKTKSKKDRSEAILTLSGWVFNFVAFLNSERTGLTSPVLYVRSFLYFLADILLFIFLKSYDFKAWDWAKAFTLYSRGIWVTSGLVRPHQPTASRFCLPRWWLSGWLPHPIHLFIHSCIFFVFFATKPMAWVVCWLCVQSREDVHTYVYHMWIWESSLLCFSWTLKLKCHILKWIPCRNFKESGIDFLHKRPQFFTPSCI